MKAGREQRVVVLHEVAQGRLTAAGAAGLLGPAVRQARRLARQYRRAGVQAVARGNRGRQPAHAAPPALRALVVGPARTA